MAFGTKGRKDRVRGGNDKGEKSNTSTKEKGSNGLTLTNMNNANVGKRRSRGRLGRKARWNKGDWGQITEFGNFLTAKRLCWCPGRLQRNWGASPLEIVQ